CLFKQAKQGKKMKFRLFVLGIAVCLASGCATIVGDSTQMIPISSTPSDAEIAITDETGSVVYEGRTPASVVLHKSDGSYWGGKTYSVAISKAGYHQQTITLESSANAWYIGGNFIFGGLIGWFVVDPLSGKMYTLSPQAISSTLGAEATHNNTSTDGSISVVLLEDVPQALLSQMTPVN